MPRTLPAFTVTRPSSRVPERLSVQRLQASVDSLIQWAEDGESKPAWKTGLKWALVVVILGVVAVLIFWGTLSKGLY